MGKIMGVVILLLLSSCSSTEYLEGKKYDNMSGLQCSVNGETCGFTVQDGGKETLYIDGKAVGTYTVIPSMRYSPEPSSPFQYAISADGESHAYIYTNMDDYGDRMGIVKDGKKLNVEEEGEESDPRYGNIEYASMGNSLTYVGSIGYKDGTFIEKDGKREYLYEQYFDVQYSPKGTDIGYIGFTGSQDRYAVFGDHISDKYFNILPESFGYSSNGEHFFYEGILFNDEGEKEWQFVLDGEVLEKIPASGFRKNFMFSPDGEGYTYSYFDSDKNQIIKQDGKQLQVKKDIVNFEYLPYGNTLVLKIKKESGKRTLFVNGEESKEYAYIGKIMSSFDGKSFAFWAQNKGSDNKVLIKDFEEIEGLDGFGYIGKQQDSFHVIKENDKEVIYIDGVRKDEYEGFKPVEGSSLIWIKQSDKWFLMDDGKEISQNYDNYIDFKYLLDGKKIAFIAENDKKKFLVQIIR